MKKNIKTENVLMAIAIFLESFIFMDLIFLVFQDIGILRKLIVILIAGFILGINAIVTIEKIYPGFCEKNRSTWCCNEYLSVQEKNMVDEAQKLLKKTDSNMRLAETKIYNVKFATHSWMNYDWDKDEISIYVPFLKFMKYGKDFCFYSLLYQIILAQHFQKNKNTFSSVEFVNELNSLLTVWLIENHSEKYKVPDQICVANFWIGNCNVKYKMKYNVLEYQARSVLELCIRHHKKLEEVFKNYVDFKPQYFYDFVPEKYF